MTNRRYERGLALILMLWLVCCFKANAQVAVTPFNNGHPQFFDVNGKPLAGGRVCFFSAGTTTPLTTYSDSAGATPNTNPVTLDSGGFANIWVQFIAFKYIPYSSVGADSNCPNAGVQQYSVDGINPGALGNTAITGTLSVSGAVTLSSTLAVTTSISVAGGTALTTTNSTGTGNLVKATSPTIATPSITGTETHSGQIQSSLATGTAPLTVASTTPVTTLVVTNHPQVSSCDGVANNGTCPAFSAVTAGKIVHGSTVLATGSTTVNGLPFTSTGSYNCTATDDTALNAVKVVKTSASVATVTGTGSDAVSFVCVGN